MKVVASHGSYSKGCFLTPLNLTSAVIGFNQENINPRFTAVRGAYLLKRSLAMVFSSQTGRWETARYGTHFLKQPGTQQIWWWMSPSNTSLKQGFRENMTYCTFKIKGCTPNPPEKHDIHDKPWKDRYLSCLFCPAQSGISKSEARKIPRPGLSHLSRAKSTQSNMDSLDVEENNMSNGGWRVHA